MKNHIINIPMKSYVTEIEAFLGSYLVSISNLSKKDKTRLFKKINLLTSVAAYNGFHKGIKKESDNFTGDINRLFDFLYLIIKYAEQAVIEKDGNVLAIVKRATRNTPRLRIKEERPDFNEYNLMELRVHLDGIFNKLN